MIRDCLACGLELYCGPSLEGIITIICQAELMKCGERVIVLAK